MEERSENEVGSVEVGKKADLILLDQDLFSIAPEAIPMTRVLATMFGGRLVHDVTWGIGDDEFADLEDFELETTHIVK